MILLITPKPIYSAAVYRLMAKQGLHFGMGFDAKCVASDMAAIPARKSPMSPDKSRQSSDGGCGIRLTPSGKV
jgi:hypothetical protein